MKLYSPFLILIGGVWLGGTGPALAQTTSLIHSFGVAGNVTGGNPACQLVQDATGALYGTTSGGEGRGTVFTLRPDGSGFQVLKMFTNTLDGAYPRGALVLSDSALYGATGSGGSGGAGTLFRLDLDGSGFTVLKNFSSTDSGSPGDGLALSGSTLFAGLNDALGWSGGIIRIQTDGTGYTVLKVFRPMDSALPSGRLLVSGGTLYGTLSSIPIGSAAVFSLGTNGAGYTVLRSFSLSEGDPSPGLVLNGGTLYGVTSFGGGSSSGTVFKLSTNGSGYTLLRSFGGYNDGQWPSGPLITDGTRLYGLTCWGGLAGCGTAFVINTNGSGYAQLAYLSSAIGDSPHAGLLLNGGMLYGTAYQGGNLASGTVFRLSTNGGGLTALKHFGYSNAANPYGALLAVGDTLYGTTYQGGTAGRGTVFKVNRDGAGYAVLRNFAFPDGMKPAAGLVAVGNVLYGTTGQGGSSGWGTVFSIRDDGGAFTNVKSFAGSGDGSNPYGSLLALEGYLYGTTYSGGESNLGTVFRLSTNGTEYSVLRGFVGSADGASPYSALVPLGGLLYGTTSAGGASNAGTIFRLKPDGSDYAVLKQFTGGADGASPRGGLVSDGAWLYGTTYSGGASGSGTVFAINPNGTGHTILRHLTSSGAAPRASLVLNGSTLYGITSAGGRGYGVVFSLKRDGGAFTILQALSASDGSAGNSGLTVLGSTLYGTTANGGQVQAGSVFGLAVSPRWTYSGQVGGAEAPFSALVSGMAGSTVIIEASEDLSCWLPLQTNVLGADGWSFTDAESQCHEKRFYRAVALP